MPEIQNAEAGQPITLIGQVKRFDVIKMLEKASTRLFHNGSQIHAAELAQAALYLRQPATRLLSPDELSSIRIEAEEDFAKRLVKRLDESGVNFEQEEAEGEDPARMLGAELASHVKDLETRIARGERALKRAKTGRRRR